MVSGSQAGETGQTVGGRAWQKWPDTGVVLTRSGSRRPLATALLRNQKVILHPLEALRLRIAVVINDRHGEPSRPTAAARWLRGTLKSVAIGNMARCSELHGVRPARTSGVGGGKDLVGA